MPRPNTQTFICEAVFETNKGRVVYEVGTLHVPINFTPKDVEAFGTPLMQKAVPDDLWVFFKNNNAEITFRQVT